ncbi:Cystine/glutamate transporter [Fasciolopsis buskii]|uniref:Cystine/glutamate transporter n=1 Tax=Fasciolopsis buskii TaxID=27845 RepID=A0A8E0S0B6_9TREM|nr:Cystine/glutamate transporter [Fasciolopsis buski]
MGKNNKKLSSKEESTENAVALKKGINVIQGVSIVVGIIIGSGIFVAPVGVLRYTHSVGLSFVMWTITGLFSALGAMVYAELGVTIPRSGGEYIYILHSFGPLLAFLALWITFVFIGAASSAANSLIFAEYLLRPFYADCDIPREAKLLVAILGLRNISSFTDAFEGSATSPGALALSFYQGFWAFAGWNYLNFLTGEVKNPARNLPIIIIISLTIVTVIYLLANVAYLAVLSPFEVLASGEGSAAVAVTFAVRCMGVMAWIMPVFVGASVFGSTNGEVLSMSRLIFTSSEEGHMPAVLSMVSVSNLTPIPSVLALALFAIPFQMIPDIFYLIELTGFAFSLISSVAVGSLLHIRRTNPGLNTSGFRLPIFFPILYLLINVALGILTILDSPSQSLISLGIMLAGVPIYLFGVAWKNKPRQFQSMMHSGTVGIQKLLFVVKPESTPAENRSSPVEDAVDLDETWAISPTPKL